MQIFYLVKLCIVIPALKFPQSAGQQHLTTLTCVATSIGFVYFSEGARLLSWIVKQKVATAFGIKTTQYKYAYICIESHMFCDESLQFSSLRQIHKTDSNTSQCSDCLAGAEVQICWISPSITLLMQNLIGPWTSVSLQIMVSWGRHTGSVKYQKYLRLALRLSLTCAV